MVSGRDRPYGGRFEVTCRDCAPASADRMGSAHVVVGCGHGCASPGRCHRGRLAAGRTRRHHGGRSPANPDCYRGAHTITVPTEGADTDTPARPDTDLAEQVHIGNFVEIKKSRVGLGSKINHLSYVGDSTVGSRVNIGAGTITCNYDGANKHRTVIGDDVFIGSDTQLIAPVQVNDGATIGAGSTITRDAPAGELTLSRVPQKTHEGWQRPVKKKR